MSTSFGPGGSRGMMAGGGGTTQTPNLVSSVSMPNPNSEWQNQTISVILPAAALLRTANTWKVGMVIASGSAMHIQKMVVRAAAVNDNGNPPPAAVVTVAGSGAFTLAAGETFTDPIAVVLDTNHDYWVQAYFDAVPANDGATGEGAGAASGSLTWFSATGDTTAMDLYLNGPHGSPVFFARFLWLS